MSNASLSSSTSRDRRFTGAFASGRTFATLALASLALPAGAHAAAFGAPAKISGDDPIATDPIAAMTPSGRTALLYGRGRYESDRTTYRLALGDSAERLGTAKTLALPGTPDGARYAGAQLLARTDGTFVLCLTRVTRTGKAQGCTIAPPGQSFGAFASFPGPPAELRAIPRPDGTTILLRTRNRTTPGGRIKPISSTMLTLDPAGRPGPERPFTRTKDEADFNGSLLAADDAAVLTDGTVAIRANYPDPSDRGKTYLGVRLMAPGADTFGPTIPVPGTLSSNDIALLGGPALTIAYRTTGKDSINFPELTRAVQRRPDGTFGRAVTVPGPQPSYYGDNLWASLAVQPDGGLFAVTERTESDPEYPDCDFLLSGTISAGALTPLGQPGAEQLLSDPKTVSLRSQVATLADGTAIATWQEGLGESGDRRMVAAIRPAGSTSFGAPRRLPQLTDSRSLVTLLSAGNHAALVWQAARGGAIVASALKTAPPYAAFVPRSRRTGTSCE